MDIWSSIMHVLEIAIGVIISSVILDIIYRKEEENEEDQ